MSQLIKKNNVIFILFLIIIISLAITITYYLIQNKNETSNYEYITFKSVSKKDTIDIYKEYYYNPIEININDNVTISGLKDKEIENNINAKLSILDTNNDNCYVNFNVSNVLSITCNEKTLNIDLTTGNDILLEEIFNQDTDIKTILISAIYNTSCNEYNNCDSSFEYEYDNTVENDITSNLTKIKNNDYNFSIYYTSFSINNLTLGGISDNYLYIYYSDFLEDNTIYDRFLTNESIYENDYEKSCNPENCTDYDNQAYFINDYNYIELYINNETYTNLTYTNTYDTQDIDEVVYESIENEIINKYQLDEVSNYQYIYVYASIYSNSNNYNIVNTTIYTTEYNETDFKKAVLGSTLSTNLGTKEYTTINMLINKNTNEITYLENNPNDTLTDFNLKTFNYILEEIKNNDNPFDGNFTYSFDDGTNIFAEDNNILSEEECYLIINNASYAIDYENNEIKMYYAVWSSLNEIYVNISIPLNIYD